MSIYAKYGAVFKILRKQRGFKLSSFSHLGISPASLCKFENGKSMIKFDTLVIALSELSISLCEYERCINNFQLEIDELLILKTIVAIGDNDKQMLIELHDEAVTMQERACAIAIRSTYEKVAKREIEWVYEYFDNIHFWRCVDLYSLFLSIELLKPRQLSYILEGFFIDDYQKNILNSLSDRLIFAHIICHSVVILSFNGFDETAKHFLTFLNPTNFSHTMHTRNLYNFAKAYWQALFTDFTLGDNNLKIALSYFKKLSDSSIFEYYQSLYNRFLVEKNNFI